LSSPIEPAAVDPHPIEPGAPDPPRTCSLYSSSRVDLAGVRLLAPPELAKPPGASAVVAGICLLALDLGGPREGDAPGSDLHRGESEGVEEREMGSEGNPTYTVGGGPVPPCAMGASSAYEEGRRGGAHPGSMPAPPPCAILTVDLRRHRIRPSTSCRGQIRRGRGGR
jgi:hypothetical protein